MTPLLAIGQSEILIIAAVALLLFGGAKLPELAKGLGQGIREFKNAMDNDTPEPTPPTSKPTGTTEKETPESGTANR